MIDQVPIIRALFAVAPYGNHLVLFTVHAAALNLKFNLNVVAALRHLPSSTIPELIVRSGWQRKLD